MRAEAFIAAILLAACSKERGKVDVDSVEGIKPSAPVAAAPAPVTQELHAGAAIPGTKYKLSYVGTTAGDLVRLDTADTAPLATLKVPPLAHDERLFMASCDVNGKLDPYVVAIVVNQPNASKFTQIRQAWRVVTASPRFEVIPVTGVTCEDPGG